MLYGGVVASAMNYSVMAWVNNAVGASVVAIFLPLQPVAGALLSYSFLGTDIYAGTSCGRIMRRRRSRVGHYGEKGRL